MSIRPMIIDKATDERIAQVKAYAQKHVVQLSDVVRMAGNRDLAVGNNPEFRLIIPIGYRAIFSYEQQPTGLCAHLSMSVDMDERPDHRVLPNTVAVQHIMFEFKMGLLSDAIHIWIEDIDDGGLGAINVLSKAEQQQQLEP